MWFVLVTIVTYWAGGWLLMAISDSWLVRLMILVVYVIGGEYAHRVGALRVERFRSAALARLVQWLAPTHFDAESAARLALLARQRRQVVFGIAPHGPLCLGLVIGFAGHCGQLPAQLSERLVIVGHWFIRALPFVRELASAFGIISSSRVTVDEAFERNQHLALIPCGMLSKLRCLVEKTPRDKHTVVVHRSAKRFGFIALAARNGALLVPVLAPDENRLYDLYGAHFGLWPLTLVLGRWLLLPKKKSTVRVGMPIDTLDFANDIPGLERAYYAALSKLAEPTHWVRFKILD